MSRYCQHGVDPRNCYDCADTAPEQWRSQCLVARIQRDEAHKLLREIRQLFVADESLGDVVEVMFSIPLGQAEEKIEQLTEAIHQTLMENLHLADGDDCTLKRLKDAIGFNLPPEN